MSYTNSSLATYKKLSPNHSGQRTHSIDRISPHCVVGQLSVESLGGIFAKSSYQASSNYGIGTDGRIALYVEEKNRSWCTSSNENDQRAVTIECASDTKTPYWMNDKVYSSLIKLCIDICKRNGKKKLIWFNDKNKSLSYKPKSDEMIITVHRWFANKSCIPTYSEVLTKNGWIKIRDIEIGDEIACADLDNLRITFEEVYDKVPIRQQDTYTNNDLTATKDHRMVYYTHNKDNLRIDDYKHLLSNSNMIHIPLAGYAKNDGLNITDDMIRFYVAVQADGHYMYEKKSDGSKSYYGIEFHLKKDRKIERIREILENCGFDWRENKKSDGSISIRIYNNSDVNIVEDVCEKFLSNKIFTWEWLNMSEEQAHLFIDELLLWDGCVNASIYTSKKKENLDIVSAVSAINGIGSRVYGNNIHFRDCPNITLGKGEKSTKRNNKQHCGKNTEVTCVSVKTGIFLIRQNGKTFIVGNCPGEWLYSRLGDVANKVTSALNESNTETEQTEDKKETVEKPVERINNTDNPEKVIWDFLIGKGLNEYAVAGLMGNLKAESNLRSTNLQNSFERKLGYSDESYTKAVDSGKYKNFVHDSAGYGLAQWTYYTRKQKLIDYAKSCNKSIGDLLMQLEFLWKEIQGYTSVMSTLKNAKSIYEASTAVLTGYEKPADQSGSVKTRRAELGKQIYNNQKKSKDESPVYSEENKYSVQAGAFSSETNAHKRANVIKSKSVNASVVFENNLYKVVTDSYATKEEAQNVIAKLGSYGIKAVLKQE